MQSGQNSLNYVIIYVKKSEFTLVFTDIHRCIFYRGGKGSSCPPPSDNCVITK